MSKYFGAVFAVLSTLALAGAAPAVASAAPRAVTASPVQRAGFAVRTFGRRPAFTPRYRTRSPYSRSYRRPGLFHGFFGGMLKLLGIAYLFHLLFGIGAGGSPLGLLLLVALIAYFAGRRRSRPMAY
jgi:hypothetical protein